MLAFPKVSPIRLCRSRARAKSEWQVNMKQTTLILTILLVLIASGFKGCGHEKDINQALDAVGIPSSAAEFKHNYKTPAGIEVKSVVDLPPHALFAIDQGILIQIDRLDHLRPMWNNYKDIRQYKVLVVEPGAYSTVDLPGAPLLMLRDGVTTAGTVIGIGGIYSAEDAVEFLLVGASAVAVGTANFTNPDTAARVVAGISDYLQRHGHTSVHAIVGTFRP